MCDRHTYGDLLELKTTTDNIWTLRKRGNENKVKRDMLVKHCWGCGKFL